MISCRIIGAIGLGIGLLTLLLGCFAPKPGEPQPPRADFSFTPITPKVGDEIVFDASASEDTDGQLVQYLWNFGDGSPEESGPTVIHGYSAVGQYTIKLTVTDDQGLSNSLEKVIKVVESQGGELEKSLPAPGQSPLGIAWDGAALWVVDTFDLKIYKVNPENGNILNSFEVPTIIPEGLTWDGGRLWLVDGAELKLLQIDPSNGKILRSLDAPGTYPTGLCWDGNALWVADADELRIFKVSPLTGKVIDSFDAPGDFPQGLAWDGQTLWNLDVTKLYQLDPNGGVVLGEYDAPGQQLADLTWDGQYLWGTDEELKKLLQFKMGE